MRRARSGRAVSERTITVFPGDDIQQGIDALNNAGGGRLLFQAGTHNVSSALTGYSNISFIGESSANTIISFSGAANLSFAGTDTYTTGTITSITGGVNVTGSGTAWLSNLTTDHQLFVGKRWYKIAAVTSDTTLVLREGFAGLGALDSFPGVSYRAAKVVKGIEIEEITFTGSSDTGLTFNDARDLIMEDIVITSCNKGMVVTNCSEISMTRVIIPANTSNGLELQSSGFGTFPGVSSAGNGGHGLVINDSRIIPFATSSMSANTGDGVNVTDSETVILEIEGAGNGGQGIELVSGNKNIFIQDSLIDGNTGDGIKLTASSDSCKITIAEIINNGGYGINIAASTCDNTIVTSNVCDDSNTSGAINDSGIGSVFSGNKGILDKVTEEATNNSGSTIAAGDVVVLGLTTSYPDTSALPQSASVVARWPFDESSGDASDIVGSNDLTNNGVGAGTGYSNGTSGVTFDNARDWESGDSDYMSRADTADLSPTGDLSMSVWINPESFPGDYSIAAKYKNTGDQRSFFWANGIGGSGSFNFHTNDDGTSGGGENNSVTGTLTTGTWQLFTVTFDASESEVRMYINGSQVGSTATGTNTSLFDSNVDFSVGARSELGDHYFDGLMNDLIFWKDAVLTDTEVSDLYDLYTTAQGDVDPGSITRTTTAGDDTVFGMAQESITDGSSGSILTVGETIQLKVNGTTDINVGDFLATYTEAGISAKASAGDMAYARALEAYATDDSNGVIDARLITPRKI